MKVLAIVALYLAVTVPLTLLVGACISRFNPIVEGEEDHGGNAGESPMELQSQGA